MICKPPLFKKRLIFPSNTPTNTYFQDKKREKFEIKRVLNDFAVTYHTSIPPNSLPIFEYSNLAI